MQQIFRTKESIKEYVRLGRAYPFPEPPLERCHNKLCSKIVQFKKHGFYERYLISSIYKGRILIRRYICPKCGRTISYLPYFCLYIFIHALENIFDYIYHAFYRTGTLKSCLDKLNIDSGLDISRQLLYHYRKRFVNNLPLIKMGIRQINVDLMLPDEEVNKEIQARELLEFLKNESTTIHSFSQTFCEKTNKTFLALCK